MRQLSGVQSIQQRRKERDAIAPRRTGRPRVTVDERVAGRTRSRRVVCGGEDYSEDAAEREHRREQLDGADGLTQPKGREPAVGVG